MTEMSAGIYGGGGVRHHPHIFRREHLHGSFFSGVIHEFTEEWKIGLETICSPIRKEAV